MDFSIKKFIPVLYYDVPPCPCCGGNKTGRYIKSAPLSDTSDDWVMEEALKAGEYVKPVPTVPEDNVFCLECGFAWKYTVPLKIISLKEREKIRTSRNIGAIENEIKRENKEKKKAQKGIVNYFKRTLG